MVDGVVTVYGNNNDVSECCTSCYLMKKMSRVKSVDNEIVLWEPKTKEQSPGEGSIDILQKYPVPECDIWFIKFSCDFHFNQLAIARSLELVRMAPSGDGMKWIMRAPKTEASAAALPPVAMRDW
ncbi:FIE2 [Panicum miliaceum]|uniref:FIE2 n=1 Tax=Panicum miliaceum TaxID=4540 RepID=A0A3L6RJX8_PANMI|nr:FIE2 [Panicum miliaceum]